MYSKKNKTEFKSTKKRTTQGDGKLSKPKPGKKKYRGQGK